MTDLQRAEWMQRIARDLQAVRAAKMDLVVNGKTVSIQGSHSYTKADLPVLQQLERDLVNEIHAYYQRGAKRRTEVPTYDK